jgi:thiol-disulfide isomerase/thioredoxin
MKHLYLKWGVAALFAVLACNVQAQLLRGTIKSKHLQDDATLIYNGNINGGSRTTEYIKLKFDAEGNFSFDDKMKAPYTAATIYLGDYSRWGIFLQSGKTAVFTATENKKKQAEAKYSGDNVQMSKFADVFIHSYMLEHYIAFDSTDVRPYYKCSAKLEKCNREVLKALTKVKDPAMRRFYTKVSANENLFLQIRMLSDTLYKAKIDYKSNARYRALIGKIDVNDPVGLKSGLPYFPISDAIPPKFDNAFGGDMTDYALAYMDIVNQKVTNAEVRKALAEDLAHQYFSYGKNNDVDRFWPVFKVFAKDSPKLVSYYQTKVDATKNTVRGRKAPDTTFYAPDGKQHKLSEYFGKLTYIDVWATWCGPCCKEIPYLEKLVDHYKGNPNIQFISISVDSNKDAWLAKLKKDKPEWKQFNLSRDEDRAFSKAWNIGGIPRFIIIDKNGNIYDADAIRPSDKDIIATLDKLMKE